MNGNATSFIIKSHATPNYNCIAWAAEEDDRWWWPDSFGDCYWPESVPRRRSLESFIEAYKSLNYDICFDMRLESGFKKIAIYVDGNNLPTHAARQLADGVWTSKLGQFCDVEHDFIEEWVDSNVGLYHLRLSDYGRIGAILRKAV